LREAKFVGGGRGSGSRSGSGSGPDGNGGNGGFLRYGGGQRDSMYMETGMELKRMDEYCEYIKSVYSVKDE
jgi:hypothetical protein